MSERLCKNMRAVECLRVAGAGVCKFGCGTTLACNAFTRKTTGPFDSALVCDCTWDQTSVYWTKVQGFLAHKKTSRPMTLQ